MNSLQTKTLTEAAAICRDILRISADAHVRNRATCAAAKIDAVMITGAANCRAALSVIDGVMRTGTKTGERK